MTSKRFFYLVLVCGLLKQMAAQTPLSVYVETALKNNPSYKAYNLGSASLQQKIKPAKALDDPMIYGGIMNLPVNFNFRQDMMTMKQIGIQQNFSSGRKYTLRGIVAQKEFDASVYSAEAQRLSLIREVKQQFYDLYVQKKSIDVLRNSIVTMKSYIEIANTRYSTGQGTQQDIFKAQVEITKMQDELIKMQSMQEDLIAIFNTLLARNKTDSIKVLEEIIHNEAPLTMDSLMKAAHNTNPMLLSMQKTLSKDSSAHELAKIGKIPDFNAGIWYGQRQALMPEGTKAKDMIGLSFGLTLPVYAKQKQIPLISSSAIEIQKTQAEIDAVKNQIELMIHHAFIDANKNQKLAALYERQLLPQATENLNAGIIGYQQNKIDFMTLVDNFISLYNYRIQYYQALAEYKKSLAELEMLTGKPLIND